MDEIIVVIVVTGAVVFAVKGFINTYQGKRSCDCSSGCGCPSKQNCTNDINILEEK